MIRPSSRPAYPYQALAWVVLTHLPKMAVVWISLQLAAAQAVRAHLPAVMGRLGANPGSTLAQSPANLRVAGAL